MRSQNDNNIHQETHNRLLDQEKAKIEYNIKALYKLSEKAYPGLTKALQGTKQASITPKQLLLSILNYIKDKELIFDKSVNRYVFFLDTKTITYKLRKKTTQGVSNRTINYLCAIGCIHKVEQLPILDFSDIEKLNDMNKKFLQEHITKSIPINCFYLELYTREVLENLEQNASRLNQASITSGNISNDILIARDLKSFSERVYKANISAIGKKIKIQKEIYQVIDFCIENKGYCTKQDIYNNVMQSNKDIDNVLRVFKLEFQEKYLFKAPNQEYRTKFNLKSREYIYITRS